MIQSDRPPVLSWRRSIRGKGKAFGEEFNGQKRELTARMLRPYSPYRMQIWDASSSDRPSYPLPSLSGKAIASYLQSL
jgi:hypothetical protein